MINYDKTEILKIALRKAIDEIKPENFSLREAFRSKFPEIQFLIGDGYSNAQITGHLRMCGLKITKELCSAYIFEHLYTQYTEIIQCDHNEINSLKTEIPYESRRSSTAEALLALANETTPDNFAFCQTFRTIFPTIRILIDRGYSYNQIANILTEEGMDICQHDLSEYITEHYLSLIESITLISQ